MALAGIWTLTAEFAFHIEYHYTTDPLIKTTYATYIWKEAFMKIE